MQGIQYSRQNKIYSRLQYSICLWDLFYKLAIGSHTKSLIITNIFQVLHTCGKIRKASSPIVAIWMSKNTLVIALCIQLFVGLNSLYNLILWQLLSQDNIYLFYSFEVSEAPILPLDQVYLPPETFHNKKSPLVITFILCRMSFSSSSTLANLSSWLNDKIFVNAWILPWYGSMKCLVLKPFGPYDEMPLTDFDTNLEYLLDQVVETTWSNILYPLIVLLKWWKRSPR